VPDPQEQLNNLFEQLSEEAKQDQASRGGTTFDKVSVSLPVLREREREYTDIEKQFVRREGWLAAAHEVCKENKRPLRYLTLPAYYRLDVALFLKEDLLAVTPRDGRNVASVVAFETEPERYARMAGLDPAFQLFALGKIEDALLDSGNGHYQDLLAAFPFDLVNLDLTSSLTPKHQGPYSRIMQAVDTVLHRQSSHPGLWGLFLTFRNVPDEWEPNAYQQFKENLQSNIDDYAKVKEIFHKRYGTIRVDELDRELPQTAISQAVLKWLVDAAHRNGMHLAKNFSYEYVRYNEGVPPYKITKHIVLFRRGAVSAVEIPFKKPARQSWMDDDLVLCVDRHKPVDVAERLLTLTDRVPDALDKIIAEITDLCQPVA